ncbi:unnamed protein product [Rotaria sp. Silwood1]|nr:unnamed protein product [Rotaria sp. Silwood1]CAF0863964.1 unnamed protein product [Rotaria sp. Silwood1]CAF3365385.1 unnamed protein product [Rotaria sp. Silwood1]CAF4590830.1 unnamed protein product [Rotaria sp. Silwood1]
MQEQERFERYTPQFPLPVDITSMSRQDTVCQFCGVSYLIHNEIKALETKCQKLEADLAYYAGISSREGALEQLLQTERTRISDLESTISIKTHKLNEMTRKQQLAQDQLEQSKIAHQETKLAYSQCTFNIRATFHQIQNIRKEHSLLKDLYSKEIQNWKTFFSSTEATLQKEIQTIMDKYTKQMNNHRIEIQGYQQQVNETNKSLRDFQIKYQQVQLESKESNTKIQNDLEAARKEIQINQNELSRLHQQVSQIEQTRLQLQNELEQVKQRCRQLEQQISDKDESKRNADLLINQYRQQLTNEKELRIKTDSELENVRSKLVKLTNEYEDLNTAKKEFETNELNTRRKIDEVSRSRQAILDRTRDEYEKLLRKYNDLDEVYRELVNIREKNTLESETIRRELERLHNENIELTKQRETLNITHDIQIKKLHDTYAIRLQEAEQWPDRFQTDLNHQREQHRIQMMELERQLKENFAIELDIEKQKTSGLLRKYEQDSDHSTQKLRYELISTEKVSIEQRQYYEQQIEQLQRDKNDLKKELDTLRDVLKELHDQTNNQHAINNDRINHLQLKEDLLAKETNLFQAQSTINELKKELEQAREEMITLQETVHKECTEREQLKDALIEARQQLLTMKKNGVLNGKTDRSLHSPPVAFEEIERRISGPLPFSHSQNQQYSSIVHNQNTSFIQSEPSTHDNSLPGDTADLMARPMSSSHSVPYRHKTLPPIYPQQQQRRNGSIPSTNKTEQLLENQRRIARFIKHIK